MCGGSISREEITHYVFAHTKHTDCNVQECVCTKLFIIESEIIFAEKINVWYLIP